MERNGDIMSWKLTYCFSSETSNWGKSTTWHKSKEDCMGYIKRNPSSRIKDAKIIPIFDWYVMEI